MFLSGLRDHFVNLHEFLPSSPCHLSEKFACCMSCIAMPDHHPIHNIHRAPHAQHSCQIQAFGKNRGIRREWLRCLKPCMPGIFLVCVYIRNGFPFFSSANNKLYRVPRTLARNIITALFYKIFKSEEIMNKASCLNLVSNAIGPQTKYQQ